MFNIAVVDNDLSSFSNIKDYIEKISKENELGFNITHYPNGMEFLLAYRPVFDIVILEVEIPRVNGLQIAKSVKEIDPDALIIFMATLSKYAINSYECGAFDYILKSVTYDTFKERFIRAINAIVKQRKKEIIIPIRNGFLRTDILSIDYIESMGHKIVIHLNGEKYTAYGKISNVLNSLPKNTFFQTNRSYLVNLRSVRGLDENYVLVGMDRIPLSKGRRGDFIEAFNGFIKS